MYYTAPARAYTIMNPHYNPSKTRNPKLVRRPTFPVPISSEFKIDLSFPQKNYLGGESISFNVKVDNPEGFNIEKVSVALVQTTTHVSADAVRRHEPPVELSSVTMGGEGDPPYSPGNVGHGKDVEWGGVLRIPETAISESTPTLNGGDTLDTLDVNYVLQVMVHKYNIGEGRIRKVTEVYPIHIGQSSSDSVTAEPEHPNLSPMTHVPHELYRRMNAHVTYSPWRLDKCAPPRYSTLSLNKDYGCGSTTSLETLPPNYDDITLQQQCIEESDLN